MLNEHVQGVSSRDSNPYPNQLQSLTPLVDSNESTDKESEREKKKGVGDSGKKREASDNQHVRRKNGQTETYKA